MPMRFLRSAPYFFSRKVIVRIAGTPRSARGRYHIVVEAASLPAILSSRYLRNRELE
jgi:hypothetical protein